jgi:GNAT superfamily N-acetyltransferase
MTIRKAVADDKMRVLNMARSFHEASGMPFAFSAAYAEALFNVCVSDEDKLCLIFEAEEGVRGVLAAHAAPHPFGPFIVATELMWWIDVSHRGRGARRMIDAYEAWAIKRGCHLVHMVGLGANPATTKLYERAGYVAAERHFMKSL